MNAGALFWVLMIICLIFNVWFIGTVLSPGLLVYVLLALLGWKVFGPAITK